MHELVVKSQNGDLTEAEGRELDSCRRVGRLLDRLAVAPVELGPNAVHVPE
jgi:hypothetical protein